MKNKVEKEAWKGKKTVFFNLKCNRGFMWHLADENATYFLLFKTLK
jgi:hypothetical protein